MVQRGSRGAPHHRRTALPRTDGSSSVLRRWPLLHLFRRRDPSTMLYDACARGGESAVPRCSRLEGQCAGPGGQQPAQEPHRWRTDVHRLPMTRLRRSSSRSAAVPHAWAPLSVRRLRDRYFCHCNGRSGSPQTCPGSLVRWAPASAATTHGPRCARRCRRIRSSSAHRPSAERPARHGARTNGHRKGICCTARRRTCGACVTAPVPPTRPRSGSVHRRRRCRGARVAPEP